MQDRKSTHQPPVRELYDIAKQYSRRADEADDLVQDLLLEAVRTGKDYTEPEFIGWGRGFLRNRAAFVARTEGRRRKREKVYQERDFDTILSRIQFPEVFITSLRPSLRIVARLMNCGLNRAEIKYLLDITDSALRQRLTSLRRGWASHHKSGKEGPEYSKQVNSPFDNGLIRRALKNLLRDSGEKVIGSCDPDGHLFTIRFTSAHKTGSGGNSKSKG